MYEMKALVENDLNAGLLAYGSAAVAYLALVVLMATSWKGRIQGALLLGACTASLLWAVMVAWGALNNYATINWILLFEWLRAVLCVWFVFRLLTPTDKSSESPSSSGGIKAARYGLMLLIAISFAVQLWGILWGGVSASKGGADYRLLGLLLLALVGLVLIEQVFRNTDPQRRWAIKFLCLGLGVGFAYDFYLYSNAVLYNGVDKDLWDARGLVQLLIVPLIGISAARNPQWSLDVFISRRVVFHTITVVTAGAYLLVMAAGGYIIRYWGGDWGTVGQVFFLVGAIVGLLSLLISGKLRAKVKVFLTKHFFRYQYDYRQEWLDLTEKLSNERQGTKLPTSVIQALAGFVDSNGGLLWQRRNQEMFDMKGYWNAPDTRIYITSNDPLVKFLESSKWIIDLDEFRASPELYEGLDLPDWLDGMTAAWLVVPLIQHDGLFGFVILRHGKVSRSLNWEDRDLLKTAGSQAAGYLALVEASEALVDARQFEAFNRLSAYVVHDIKNVVGQLSLVVDNASKFKHNPEFVDDAFATVENAVAKMQRMLGQLRAGKASLRDSSGVKHNIRGVVEEVAKRCQTKLPTPLIAELQDATVVADRDRLVSVIEHVVNNAQEATENDGHIEIRVKNDVAQVVVEIEDNGCGMDYQFVRDRLFRPFDTTKGNAGMGIGVYECREFVRSLGGEVEVESWLGKGTLFRLLIPRVDG